MQARFKAHNQQLSNYAYVRLKAATPEEKARLTPEERQIFRSDLSLDKFCRTASKEELECTLTKIGVQWVQIFANNTDDILGMVDNSFEQASFPLKRRDLIQKMVESNIFITNSNSQMVGLQIAAQLSHSEAYQTSQYAKEIIRNGKLFKQAYKDVQGREAEMAYETYTTLLCNQINSFDWVEENLNVNQNELMILSILFKQRNKAINQSQIAEYIQFTNRNKYVGKFLNSLEIKGYVQSDGEPGRNKHFMKKVCFIITSLGIAQIIKYHNYMHEITFGKKKKRYEIIN